MHSPVLVTGAARSGTSMVAGVLSKMGLWGGELVGANQFNRKGMFENRGIRQKVLKPLLREMGADELGQDPLPDIDMAIAMRHVGRGERFRKDAEAILRDQGYQGQPWFYKGAKLCLVWPIIDQAWPDAKWVIVRRDGMKIAESCLRTTFMHRRTNLEDWLDWVDEHEERFMEMQCHGDMSVLEVWSDKVAAGDQLVIEGLCEYAGVNYDAKKLDGFIDAALFHKAE